MVALRPFTLAIGLAAGETPGRLDRARLSLAVRERRSGALLGRVRLRPRPAPPLAAGIQLFVTGGCANYCLPPPRLQLHYLREWWRLRRDRNPRNTQKMAAAELFSKWVLFCQPRPVVLVSYAAAGGANIFPMDLVGPAAAGRFLLGLHQPSPAIAPILQSGRLAISALPLDFRALAFGLGSNHRHAAVDLDALPFAIDRSAGFGLPVPRAALAVREVEVEQTASLGSHLLLVTATAHFERRGQGLQMCHVHGFYQRHLERLGQALPAAAAAPPRRTAAPAAADSP